MKTIEVVIPELLEMRTAHVVSIGSEGLCSMNPDFEDGYVWVYWYLVLVISFCSLIATRQFGYLLKGILHICYYRWLILDSGYLYLAIFMRNLCWFLLLLFCHRKGVKLTYDTRTSMALFRSFTAADYVAAQCIRSDNSLL